MTKIIYALPLLLLGLTSCLGDDDKDPYKEWRIKNDNCTATLASEVAAGISEYTKVVPSWATSNSVFIKWHNDRALTAANLTPLSNSTVNITYQMEDIEGNDLGDSFTSLLGDSIYQSKPNQNIVGMWAAMLEMHVGDSVTMVIPYISGYGAREMKKIKPYSNLIYHVKMKEVVKYEY